MTKQAWENTYLGNRRCHGEMNLRLEREEACKVTLMKIKVFTRWQGG